MNGVFKDLEDEKTFTEFVRAKCLAIPTEITSIMWCQLELAEDRVKYAHGEYRQNIDKFALFLQSSNPDHYKRAGALLHALYKADFAKFHVEASGEELESGFSRINVGDAKYALPYVTFWEAYHNQILSFDLAYRCCCSYEANPTPLSLDYLHNVVRYLKTNDLTIDSCFMLFRSLMEH
jgi:hypothetical protein